MKTNIITTVFLFFIGVSLVKGQGATCSVADPFCSGTAVNFPASTSNPSGSGSLGCLGSSPNPAWYYLNIANSGNLILNITMTDASGYGQDVDFICYGPYTSLATACSNQTGTCSGSNPLSGNYSGGCTGNIVDCSYSSSSQETVGIANAVAGQWYMLLLTNYSGVAANISLTQTNSGPGTGSTNCAIVNPVSPCPVTASNNGPICVGQNLNLTATTLAGATYQWTGPNGFTSNLQNPTINNVTANMAGTYVLATTVTSTVSPCNSNSSTTVVFDQLPSIHTNNPIVCTGKTTTLTATGANSYTWSPNVISNNLSGSSVSASPNINTMYTVIGSNACGNDTAFSQVTVIQSPDAIISDDITVCRNGKAQLYIKATVGMAPFTYTYTTSESTRPKVIQGGDSIAFNPTTDAVGSIVYTLKNIKDVNGCTNTIQGQSTTVNVIEIPTPLFTVSPEVTTILEPEINIQDASLAATTWEWSFGDGTESKVKNPEAHSYADTGTYTIKLVVKNTLCKDSTYQTVKINLPLTLYIPSAFTPDGDGINDEFRLSADGFLKMEYFIYDRWGIRLFYSDDINKPWDGRVNGGKNPAEMDTYVYVVNIKGYSNKHDYTYRGTFNLIK